MKDATLVVMAAGMGSRFGGLKQMEPIGPNGEVILDFTVYDAKKAGFNKVVFILKEEIKDEFISIVGKRIEKSIDVEYVIQSMDLVPEGRKKPFGTGHAILCCKDVVKTPFVVVNADDYYGSNAFMEVRKFLETAKGLDIAMVGYHLGNTLTENGTVARGVCEIEDGYLKKITERTKINSKFEFTEDDGKTWKKLSEDTIVSMNLWGFTPDIFSVIEKDFKEFLANADLSKDEFFIPKVVDDLICENKTKVRVLNNADKWYGMTYKEDKESVKKAIAKLVSEGIYSGIK